MEIKNKDEKTKATKEKEDKKKRKVNLADIPEVMILRRLEECVIFFLYMTILRTKKGIKRKGRQKRKVGFVCSYILHLPLSPNFLFIQRNDGRK